MKKLSDNSESSEELRKRVLGMGDNSVRKSYFPALKERIAELERYHALLDQTNDGIVLLSFPDLIVTEENMTARRLLPEIRKDVSFFSLIEQEECKDKLSAWIKKDKKSDQPLSFSYAYKNIEGNEVKLLEYTLTKVTFKSEQAITLVIRNITKQKKIEEELRQAHKMDAIGKLAGGIAHDYNNALAGIVNAAELLCMKMDDNDELKPFTELILNAADNAAALTRQLLTFSRKDNVAFQTVNLHQILNDTIEILKHTVDKRIHIKKAFQADNVFIIGDYSQLQSSFLNLGINSRDSMKSGGEIIYSTSECELSHEFCNDSQFNLSPGRYLLLSVEDSGSGIDKEIIKKIFDPFFTTKEMGKGTGLGLSTVYGTVKDHNGAITVYSETGIGTCFNIYLPIRKGTALKSRIQGSKSLKKGTILLADDDSIVLSTARVLLGKLGYTVVEACNGQEAYNYFKDNSSKISLIILDEIMPVSNGLETLKKIRKIDLKVPIILSSGFSQNNEREKLIQQGICNFIKKPFRLNELQDLISEISAVNNNL